MTFASTLKAGPILKSSQMPIAFLLTSVTPLVAVCQTYLTEQQATQVLFPGQVFSKQTATLSDDEAKCVTESSEQKLRTRALKLWASPANDYVYVDEVIGKHEYITYAVGIDREGKIKGIEILVYRESYGQQIAGKGWRKQFVGKSVQSSLKFNEDIKNISGATLSSSHVTAGVKRILHTHECMRSRLKESTASKTQGAT